MTPSIDVVVPTWNGWSHTESCLRHLAGQTVPHSVIVADNGSTDGTPARVREQFSHAKLVELGSNRGFATASNAGVAAGEGEILVLLNNDVDCRPAFIETLVAPFEGDETIGSAASLMLSPDERTLDSVGLTADRTLAGFPRLRGLPLREAAAPRPKLTGPSAGAGAYRRRAFQEAGGFDEAIFAYLEDLDLALRLHIAGWRAVAAPEAVCVHAGGASFGRRSVFQRRHAGFSRGYLLRRYGVLRTRAAGRALVTEAAVVTGDALANRDAAALRGRLAGWRAAAGRPRRPEPPTVAVDEGITLGKSIRLRRARYVELEAA